MPATATVFRKDPVVLTIFF